MVECEVPGADLGSRRRYSKLSTDCQYILLTVILFSPDPLSADGHDHQHTSDQQYRSNRESVAVSGCLGSIDESYGCRLDRSTGLLVGNLGVAASAASTSAPSLTQAP